MSKGYRTDFWPACLTPWPGGRGWGRVPSGPELEIKVTASKGREQAEVLFSMTPTGKEAPSPHKGSLASDLKSSEWPSEGGTAPTKQQGALDLLGAALREAAVWEGRQVCAGGWEGRVLAGS